MTDFAIDLEKQDPKVDKNLLLDVIRLQDEDIYKKRLELNKSSSLLTRAVVIVVQLFIAWGLYVFLNSLNNIGPVMFWLPILTFVGWNLALHIFLSFKAEAKYRISLYILRKFPSKEAFLKNFAISFMLNENIYETPTSRDSRCISSSMRDYQKNKELEQSLAVFNEHLDKFYNKDKLPEVVKDEMAKYVSSVVRRVERRREEEKEAAHEIVVNDIKRGLTKQDILTYWKD